MEQGKCITTSGTTLRFSTYEGECYLHFGANAKFDFKYITINTVRLERKNMTFTIPKDSFNKLFKVC